MDSEIDNADRDDLLGNLLEELIQQQRTGQPVELDKVCEAHPGLANELRDLYSAMFLMERHKPAPPSEAQLPSSVRDLGSIIGGYQILREIGRGGMGIVFEAIQLSLGRHVALKVISGHLIRDANAIERFRREARLASLLHHSNIVPVFDVGEENGVCFYAMQYIPGQSLDQVIGELSATKAASANNISEGHQTSSTAQAGLARNSARIASQVAEALAYAHGRGILHRDIKPSNILVDSSGNAWVADFGLARFDDSSTHEDPQPQLTETGNIAGTLRYLAPERLQGINDHRCDIYGLAATAYELVTGRPVFESVDRVHLMDLLVNHRPVDPRKYDDSIPRDLETILLKGLSREPELRYQSAQSMADDLKLFLLDRPIQARRPSFLEKTIRWCRRNRLTTALGSVLLLAIAALLGGLAITRTLQNQRDEAVSLMQRATVAENESRISAMLNDVAAYRMKMGPGLTPQRQKLEQVAPSAPNEDLRLRLRNEITACLMQADWYPQAIDFPLAARIMAIDSKYQTAVGFDPAELKLTISQLDDPTKATEVPLGFHPEQVRFSENSGYLFAVNQGQCQILRTADWKPVFSSIQNAIGCDVREQRNRAAVWTADRKIRLFQIDSPTPQEQQTISIDGDVLSCRIHPQQPRIACVTVNSVQLWDLERGEIVRSIPINGNGVLEWSPDGLWLAVALSDSTIQIRNARDLQLHAVIPKQGSYVFRFAWDRKSQRIATQNWDRATYVFDVWTGRILVRSKQPVTAVQFGDDDCYVGWDVGEEKLTLLKWEPGLVQDLPADAEARAEHFLHVAIQPAHGMVATASIDRVFCFDGLTGVLLASFPNYRPIDLSFSQDGKQLIVLGANSIQRWPIKGGRDLGQLSFGPPVVVRCAESGSGFVSSNSESAYTTNGQGEVVELDLHSGQNKRTISLSEGLAIRRIADPERFVLYDWQLPLHQFRDLQNGKQIGTLNTGNNGIVFVDSSLTTAVAANPKEYRFFEYPSFKPSGKPGIPTPIVGAQIAWSESRQEMALQTMDQFFDLVDPDSHQLLCRLPTDPRDNARWLGFIDNDRYLIGVFSGSGMVRRWDVGGLRHALRKLDLDWDSQPISIVEPKSFAQVEVDLGELDDRSLPWIPLALDEAKQQYQLEPNSPRTLNNLAWRLLMSDAPDRDNKRALELSTKAVELDPDSLHYRNTYGLALYRNGEFALAKQLLEANLHHSNRKDQVFDWAALALIARATEDEGVFKLYQVLIEQYLGETTTLNGSTIRELNLLKKELQSLER